MPTNERNPVELLTRIAEHCQGEMKARRGVLWTVAAAKAAKEAAALSKELQATTEAPLISLPCPHYPNGTQIAA